MQTVETIPEGYHKIFSLHLQKNKKVAVLVNLLALLIAAVMAVPALFLVPIRSLFDQTNLPLYFLRFGVLLAGMLLYIILHEWTHGLAMSQFSQNKVKYGWSGLYAYAGSDDDCPKTPYVRIALAPLVLWGILLTIVLLLVPEDWFWVVYWLQIFNVSGAAGDLYVVWRFRKLPREILIQDNGISMSVFAKEISE